MVDARKEHTWDGYSQVLITTCSAPTSYGYGQVFATCYEEH